jgi:hypothetical protein
MSGFALSYTANMFILKALCDFCLQGVIFQKKELFSYFTSQFISPMALVSLDSDLKKG